MVKEEHEMIKENFIYWQEDLLWIGYLEEYPDYWTQGETLQELKNNLADIYKDLVTGKVESVRKVGKLIIS
jgi:predicted RNase H-like HicB family nuclease